MERPEQNLEELLFYRNCLDKAAISIFQSDENGTIFYANEFACAGLGYTMEELRSLSVFDIDPAVTREKMLELKKILDTTGSVTHESIHRRKDGTTFPVEITVNHLEFQDKVYGISLVKDITERKEVEEELLLTQHCFDNASIAIHRAQPDGKISHANRQMCRNLGYTRAELNSMSVFEIDPTITPEKLQEVERLGLENGSCTFESKHCRKDGTSFPVEITVNYWDINGRKMHMAFVQDITERKQVEEALLLSQYCIDKAGIGVYQNDHTGAIFSVNEQACKSLGYSKEELCALSVFDIDPEITPEKMLELGKILDEKRTATLYTTHLRKDGTTFPVEITINCLDFRGKRYGISFVKDITERKRAEEERRKSEENFSIVFQATPDLIAITRMSDGTIQEVNEAFTRLLGYSRPEAVGKTTGELSIWADPADRARWMAALEATGQVDEFETTLRRRDGSLITCVSTARPLDFRGEKCVLSVVRDINERKRAEEELRLTQFCVDKASIALYQLTMEGDIWNVNEYACQSLGYSMEELRSMSVFDIDPTATREVYNDLASRMLSCGSITFERTHRRKDGTIFPVEITANFLEFGGRKFGICFVKDIVERKQAEEAIRESSEKYQAIVDTFDGFILTCSQDYRVEFMNRKLIERTGYDATGEFCYKAMHDRDSICPWCVNELVFAGETVHREMLFPKDNRWYYVMNAPIRHADGSMSKHSMAVEITERRLTEKALRESEERLRFTQYAIEKTIDQAFWMTEDGRLFYVNDAACRTLGYTREELLQMSVPDFCPPAPPEVFAEHWRDLKENGHVKLETLHQAKDGRVYPVEVRANFVVFDGKEYNCAFATDITDRKQAEEALRKAHDELESKVRERTRQLSAITHELSLAEERERRRIAGELHDQVGQSLILSKLKLDSISSSTSPGELESLLSEIRGQLGRSIENIRSLTFQLSPPLLYEVGFEAAVEWLAEEFEEEFGFRVNFHDDKKPKPLDEKERVILYQMVRELMINIAKHAAAKNVSISIVKADDNIRVIVADDGKGIDPAMSLHTITRNGTFGLFNIRHRIEHLGGSLKIESDTGCGTRVSLGLPLRQDSGADNNGRTNGYQDNTRG